MRRIGFLIAVILVSVTLFWWVARSGPPQFKVYVTEAGAYKITFEALADAGFRSKSIRSDRIAMTHLGRPVPIWVADGGDGRLGPGEWIEFVGQKPKGERSAYNEHTMLNVYRLEIGRSGGLRMSRPESAPEIDPAIPLTPMVVKMHVEINNFMVHFNAPKGEIPEPRFWARISHIDRAPFEHPFRLGHWRDAAPPLSLRVELRGWSTAGRSHGRNVPDHRAEVSLNGTTIGSGEWNGRTAHIIDIPAVPPELVLQDALNVIQVTVPKRRPDPDKDAVIDMVLLNWIEITHPAAEAQSERGGAWIAPHQQRLALPDVAEDGSGSRRRVRLASSRGAPLVVFGDGGARYDSETMAVENLEMSSLFDFNPDPGETTFFIVRNADALKEPVAIEVDRPSDLKSSNHQADYIIIAHPRLIEATEPLAAFHRRHGRSVSVVAVDDIYDEFNDSMVRSDAIRDFLSHAYHHWKPPAPRWVLLVGDASWDAEGIGSKYPGGPPFSPDVQPSHRNLIPTSAFEMGFRGHSASDNFFVSVDGDDANPDMAIGRFPVTEPEEVAAIVRKNIRYAESAPVGPWRRNILWLSDESPFMQRYSDEVVDQASERGFRSLRLYADKEKGVTEETQTPLRKALNDGQMIVHFFGHGARYVWRTGAATHKNNFDLFTLDDVQKLNPTERLPLVLSMTCWSAPFDHPTRDSIGERFLRLEDRGGIAFLGASWKVSSNPDLSHLIFEELEAQDTVGEAIMMAKRRLEVRGLVEKYNLLGDPALVLADPGLKLEMTVRTDDDGHHLEVTVPDPEFTGRAIIEWFGPKGEPMHADEIDVLHPTFQAEFTGARAIRLASRIHVYAWNASTRVDGIGSLDLLPPESEEPAPKATP